MLQGPLLASMTFVHPIDALIEDPFLLNETFPHPEGSHIEFKARFDLSKDVTHTPSPKQLFAKYRHTVCAFLNGNGGHLIFGVTDARIIKGQVMTLDDLDRFRLYVDHLYNELYLTDGNQIAPNTLVARNIAIAKNTYVSIISCYPCKGCRYQLQNGEVWERMNASTRRFHSRNLLYTQREVDELLKKHRDRYDNEVKELVIKIDDALYKNYRYYGKLQHVNQSMYLLVATAFVAFIYLGVAIAY